MGAGTREAERLAEQQEETWKRTETPWEYMYSAESALHHHVIKHYEEGGYRVVAIFPHGSPVDEANAKYIVKTANSYNELVKIREASTHLSRFIEGLREKDVEMPAGVYVRGDSLRVILEAAGVEL